MKNINCKYLIVGGGVSGLMFANLVKEEEFFLVEKEEELGGFCRTIYKSGFVWDYAGHFFHFANPLIKKFFEEKIPSEELVLKDKITKIKYKNNFIDFPFQSNIHQLDKDDFIDCIYDLYFKEEREKYSSFLEMLYGKFGRSITEKFLKPYNEKLYSCDLNDLDSEAMGRFFPYANLEKIISNFKKNNIDSYNSKFSYPKNGAKIFVDALSLGINKERISLNDKLYKLDSEKKIAYTDKHVIKYEYLVNTSPLNVFSSYFDEKIFVEFAEKASSNKVLVFNIGFDRESLDPDIHWIYFPEKEYNFYRVGFYNNILGSNRLSIYVEIGFDSNSEINVDEEFEKTIDGLKKSGLIDSHKVVDYCSLVMSPAYVHVDKEVEKIKNFVKNRLSEKNIFTIGRYGDWKYCSIEDSILDAFELFKFIKSS